MADQEIITTWFQQYSDDIYNFLIYYTGKQDVEDLVQEVFIKAIRNIHSFRHDSNPKTWLYSIARNVAIDQLRKESRERKKETKVFQQDVHSHTKTPEDIYQLSETKAELYNTLQKLRKNYKEVLLLRGIKEFTVEETAQVLNWSENKVKVTFHRALKSLEKHLGGTWNGQK